MNRRRAGTSHPERIAIGVCPAGLAGLLFKLIFGYLRSGRRKQ